MTTRYKVACVVTRVEERFIRRHVSGMGESAQFIEDSNGWWVTLTGDISVCLGDIAPRDIAVGDRCYLILEKTK
jgi:hypothetical protein